MLVWRQIVSYHYVLQKYRINLTKQVLILAISYIKMLIILKPSCLLDASKGKILNTFEQGVVNPDTAVETLGMMIS